MARGEPGAWVFPQRQAGDSPGPCELMPRWQRAGPCPPAPTQASLQQVFRCGQCSGWPCDLDAPDLGPKSAFPCPPHLVLLRWLGKQSSQAGCLVLAAGKVGVWLPGPAFSTGAAVRGVASR